MLKIEKGSRFGKDLKKYKHLQNVINELNTVLRKLTQNEALPAKYRDHPLSGEWNPARECHIKPDVLLIYRIDKKNKLLILVRIGSHSELFT